MSEAATEDIWDVLIVGAGPAGTSSANLLARDGHRVLVLEKDAFPRFHIGESLLPLGTATHERLGLEPDPDCFILKTGAEFVHEDSDRSATFTFSEALGAGEDMPESAWQVERAKFDTQLRDLAREAGAEVRHGVKVTDIAIDDGGVTVTADGEAFRGRYVIDATGQDRFLARRGRTVKPFKNFGKAAVFCHFEGLSDATMEEIGPGHDIRIMLIDDGWAWFIPLANRRLSVGVVTQNKTATTGLMDEYIANSPMLRRWIEGATQSEPQIIRNFSYKNEVPNGARFACIGDAGCFLDPVFSSGVAIAMESACLLVDTLSPALREGREGDPSLLDPMMAHMDEGYAMFAALIDRFYNTNFGTNFFLSTGGGDYRRGLISLLAGDVWRDHNPFKKMLAGSRRRRRSVAVQPAMG